MNVSVLTMALGESLGLSPSAVRAFGLAELRCHDGRGYPRPYYARERHQAKGKWDDRTALRESA